MRNSTIVSPVNSLGNFVSPTEIVRGLGVWLDNDFSFSTHIQNTCKSCFVHIWDHKCLRGYLTCNDALMTANTLVGSRRDYYDSLFRSLSALDLCNLYLMYPEQS